MNKVARIISEEIGRRGAISFARFMELALYCPIYGYYETERDSIGRRGDFFTNVSVGSLFGELLAWQFAEWLLEIEVERGQNRADDGNHGAYIVEAGAHNGILAKDVLNWLRTERPRLFEHVQYLIIEPSAQRRTWQERTLLGFRDKVRWAADLPTLKFSQPPKNHSSEPGIAGIIFSNEFLDSFPVHRYAWDAEKWEWFEWGVMIQESEFAWTRLADVGTAARDNPGAMLAQMIGGPARPNDLLEHLPDGFTFEVSPTAESWWRDAAQLLQRGKLLTFDYGFVDEEILLPERHHGTIRAYHKHQTGSNVLQQPGEQDLTSHINFPAFQAIGEEAGLRTEAMLTQEEFLTRIAGRAWKSESAFIGQPERMRQFQTLTHPEHLGRRFRLLQQARC